MTRDKTFFFWNVERRTSGDQRVDKKGPESDDDQSKESIESRVWLLTCANGRW